MIDRPTPETDANSERDFDGIDSCDATFARRLERQRDEAREELLKQRVENNHNWQAVADLEEMITLARELRDALGGLVHECMLSDFNEHWDTFVEAEAALTKAKEVLP